MYQVKDIVKVVTLSHPAIGATDECRVLFRHVPAWNVPAWNHKAATVRWVVYQSKGAYIDQPRFDVYKTRTAALEALGRPARQDRIQQALYPCACDPNGKYFCVKHPHPTN